MYSLVCLDLRKNNKKKYLIKNVIVKLQYYQIYLYIYEIFLDRKFQYLFLQYIFTLL